MASPNDRAASEQESSAAEPWRIERAQRAASSAADSRPNHAAAPPPEIVAARLRERAAPGLSMRPLSPRECEQVASLLDVLLAERQQLREALEEIVESRTAPFKSVELYANHAERVARAALAAVREPSQDRAAPVPAVSREDTMSGIRVAALYVETNGVYYGLPDVDPWDEERDARLYAGPWPVVAHPPCARWSRTAALTEAWFGYRRGEDGGCFEAALASVREYGGVIEHPAYTAAWARFGLPRPIRYDGWTHSLLDDGASCDVEQARYGLASKKPTWLYAYGVELPELRWGMIPHSEGTSPRDPGGGGMHAFRDRHRKKDASRTPEPFRDVLLDMARSAAPVPAASREDA